MLMLSEVSQREGSAGEEPGYMCILERLHVNDVEEGTWVTVEEARSREEVTAVSQVRGSEGPS